MPREKGTSGDRATLLGGGPHETPEPRKKPKRSQFTAREEGRGLGSDREERKRRNPARGGTVVVRKATKLRADASSRGEILTSEGKGGGGDRQHLGVSYVMNMAKAGS